MEELLGSSIPIEAYEKTLVTCNELQEHANALIVMNKLRAYGPIPFDIAIQYSLHLQDEDAAAEYLLDAWKLCKTPSKFSSLSP